MKREEINICENFFRRNLDVGEELRFKSIIWCTIDVYFGWNIFCQVQYCEGSIFVTNAFTLQIRPNEYRLVYIYICKHSAGCSVSVSPFRHAGFWRKCSKLNSMRRAWLFVANALSINLTSTHKYPDISMREVNKSEMDVHSTSMYWRFEKYYTCK